MLCYATFHLKANKSTELNTHHSSIQHTQRARKQKDLTLNYLKKNKKRVLSDKPENSQYKCSASQSTSRMSFLQFIFRTEVTFKQCILHT